MASRVFRANARDDARLPHHSASSSADRSAPSRATDSGHRSSRSVLENAPFQVSIVSSSTPMRKPMAAATSETSAASKPRTFPGWAANIQSLSISRRWRRWRSSWKTDSLLSPKLDHVVSIVRTDPNLVCCGNGKTVSALLSSITRCERRACDYGTCSRITNQG